MFEGESVRVVSLLVFMYMVESCGWSRTGPYFGMSSHWCRVHINVYNINDRASPRGKGRIADEDSAPCSVQCLESKRRVIYELWLLVCQWYIYVGVSQ